MDAPNALYILSSNAFTKIYGPEEQMEIASLCNLYATPQTAESIAENPELLYDVEIIFSGWGAPQMDAKFLAAAPHLKAVFYGAGSVKKMVTDAFWNRGIILTSAWAANGIPVSEFALAEILFSLKHGWKYVRAIHDTGAYVPKTSSPSLYGSTVAIISLGMIGRKVTKLLKNFHLNVVAYDPFVTQDTADKLGVRLVSLEEAFRIADVVSLHTPLLPETKGMITEAHLRSMKPGATFVNTARGAIVDEPAMIRVLQERPDIFAVLDVTNPEPPVDGSPLYTMPNVFMTPHISGSTDQECRRLGQSAVEECRAYLEGRPLKWRLTKEMAAKLA